MNILVTSPSFFKYENFIVDELIKMGHQVKWLDDRKGLNFIRSAMLRLGFLKKRITKKVESEFQSELYHLGEINFFLCISPEGMSSNLIGQIIKMADRSILYMWDSFENKPSGRELLKIFDKVYSFDVLDSHHTGIHYLPLYYPNSYHCLNYSRKKKVLIHCSVHSHRAHLVKLLINNGVDINPQFYVRNAILLIFRFFKGEIPVSMIKYVSFQSLDHSALNQLYNEHEFVLDISHPAQSGMTNRTWEVLASGARLITTNRFASQIPGLSEYQIFILNTDLSNLAELRNWMKKTPNMISGDLQKYSLDSWIKQILC